VIGCQLEGCEQVVGDGASLVLVGVFVGSDVADGV